MRKLTKEEKERVVFEYLQDGRPALCNPEDWDEVWETGRGYFLAKDNNGIQNLYKGYIKEEWKPKKGEEVLMSDDKEDWYSTRFYAMEKNEFSEGSFNSDGKFFNVHNYWKYCKPFPKDFKIEE